MNKLGGGYLIVVAVVLVMVGWLIQSTLLEWLLNIIGFVAIFAGVIIGIYGLIKVVSGGKNDSDNF